MSEFLCLCLCVCVCLFAATGGEWQRLSLGQRWGMKAQKATRAGAGGSPRRANQRLSQQRELLWAHCLWHSPTDSQTRQPANRQTDWRMDRWTSGRTERGIARGSEMGREGQRQAELDYMLLIRNVVPAGSLARFNSRLKQIHNYTHAHTRMIFAWVCVCVGAVLFYFKWLYMSVESFCWHSSAHWQCKSVRAAACKRRSEGGGGVGEEGKRGRRGGAGMLRLPLAHYLACPWALQSQSMRRLRFSSWSCSCSCSLL